MGPSIFQNPSDWSLINQCSESIAFKCLFKVQRTCLLEIHICQVWHTVFDFNKVTGFDAQIFQISALYLAFEIKKNIHIFQGMLGALEDAWVNDLGLAS